MIGLFELLVEIATQTGKGITAPQARAYLESIAGGGKAARLAKTLLDLPVSCSKIQARNVATQILTSRIERAERWQRAVAAHDAPYNFSS